MTEPWDDPAQWFEADVTILDTTTGETRVYRSKEYQGGDGWSDFIWDEGNYACDCNRYLFFERAGGHEPFDDEGAELQCGSGRYRVLRLVRLSDGALLYSEAD